MYLKIDIREEEKKRSGTTQHRGQFSPEKKGVSLSIFSHFHYWAQFYLWMVKLIINKILLLAVTTKKKKFPQMFLFNIV